MSSAFAPLKILIVDDDPDDQFMLKKIFHALCPSAELEQAYNGAECINCLAKQPARLPDLITMDLNMPLVNGIEATALIKKDERFRHIPLVVLSTSSRANDKDLVLSHGADDYVTKPVLYEDLYLTLRNVTEKWLRENTGY